MARSAHEQSDYSLRKLPTCSRCNSEFILVLSGYEHLNKVCWEWECPRCHKVVPKELLKEEDLKDEDSLLSKAFGNPQKKYSQKRNRRRKKQ